MAETGAGSTVAIAGQEREVAGPALGAYWHLLRAQVRSQTAYRGSFAAEVLASTLATGFDLVAVLVLFRVTTQLGGFTVREALVMVGVSSCAFAIADLAVGQIERLQRYVRVGQLDTVLIRPLRALPQLLLSNVAFQLVGRAALGSAVLVVVLGVAPVDWDPARVVLAVAAPLAGAVFFGAVFVAGSTVAFWWVGTGELANSLTYGGRDFTAYPMTIYGEAFRRVLGYGTGFAFVAYYPALALLDRTDPIGLPGWVGWVSPAVAVPAVAVAALCWRVGIRHYRSTGS